MIDLDENLCALRLWCGSGLYVRSARIICLGKVPNHVPAMFLSCSCHVPDLLFHTLPFVPVFAFCSCMSLLFHTLPFVPVFAALLHSRGTGGRLASGARASSCPVQLATKLQVLQHGSMTRPAAKFHRTAGFFRQVALIQLPSTPTRQNSRSFLGEFDFTTHRRQASDNNDRSANVCNLEIDVDACPLTLKPDSPNLLSVAPLAARMGVVLGVRLVVNPAQNCGGQAESGPPLSMTSRPPSTLPSLCSEARPSMRIPLLRMLHNLEASHLPRKLPDHCPENECAYDIHVFFVPPSRSSNTEHRSGFSFVFLSWAFCWLFAFPLASALVTLLALLPASPAPEPRRPLAAPCSSPLLS